MKRRKRNFAELVADASGFPDTVILSTPDIHIVGTREVSVDGCRGILVYENTEIQLRLKDRIMRICGEQLSLKTYFAAHVTVRGRISSLSFEEDE